MKKSRQTHENTLPPRSPRAISLPSSDKSWKVGKYWANSGTQNPVLQKISSAKLLPTVNENKKSPLWLLKSFDAELSPVQKNFTSNSESKVGWDLKFYKYSMVNHQNRDYDFIANIKASKPEVKTTSRQKGLGEFIDNTRLYRGGFIGEYQATLRNDPNAFRKKTGEFTKHQDNCVKLSGFGPFHRLF